MNIDAEMDMSIIIMLKSLDLRHFKIVSFYNVNGCRCRMESDTNSDLYFQDTRIYK